MTTATPEETTRAQAFGRKKRSVAVYLTTLFAAALLLLLLAYFTQQRAVDLPSEAVANLDSRLETTETVPVPR